MTIHLLNFSGRKIPVEVPDETKEIIGIVVSGDMIMLSPVYFDTAVENPRLRDYYVGHFRCSVEELEQCEDPYNLLK